MKRYMLEALKEAKSAAAAGDIPVGAVIIRNGEIIGRGRNRTFADGDPTAHAEILAIREASKRLGGRKLTDCEMFVTLEPCAMCAGAIVLARLRKIHIAAKDPKTGACGSVFNIVDEPRLNHRAETEYGLLQEESSALIKDFFKDLRKQKLEEKQK